MHEKLVHVIFNLYGTLCSEGIISSFILSVFGLKRSLVFINRFQNSLIKINERDVFFESIQGAQV